MKVTKVTKDSVLAALRAANGRGLRNVEIRAAVFGKGKENDDQAGSATTEVLQALKVEERVRLERNRWFLADSKPCPACNGKGVVPT